MNAAAAGLCAGGATEVLVPGCVTVAVKRGMSRPSACTHTPGKARDLIRQGAELAMGRLGRIEPLRLRSPVLFREVLEKPTFDPENPSAHSRVIDGRTREIEGEDTLDVLFRIYPNFRRDWQPAPW